MINNKKNGFAIAGIIYPLLVLFLGLLLIIMASLSQNYFQFRGISNDIKDKINGPDDKLDTRDQYNITLYYNDNKTPNKTIKARGIDEVETPERTGYDFVIWYYLKDVKVEVTPILEPASDVSTSETNNVEKNKTIYIKPTKTGKVEFNWNLSWDDEKGMNLENLKGKVTVTGEKGTIYQKEISSTTDIELASFDVEKDKTYTIVFSAIGYNSSLENERVDVTLKYEDIKNYYEEKQYDYDEKGEMREVTGNFTKDSDIIAEWTPINYTITYNLNEGTLSNPKTSYTVEEVYELPEPTRTGYRFLGWYENSSFTGTTVTQIEEGTTGDKTYYAKWIINNVTYDIVYRSTSGKVLKTDTITKVYGETYTITPIDIQGYTTPSSQNIAWDSVTAKTITFNYAPTNYTITYNLNGGTISSSKKTSYTIESDDYTLLNPSKTGNEFKGWYATSDYSGDVVIKITKGTTGNITLYANWNWSVELVEYRYKDVATWSSTLTKSTSYPEYYKEGTYKYDPKNCARDCGYTEYYDPYNCARDCGYTEYYDPYNCRRSYPCEIDCKKTGSSSSYGECSAHGKPYTPCTWEYTTKCSSTCYAYDASCGKTASRWVSQTCYDGSCGNTASRWVSKTCYDGSCGNTATGDGYYAVSTWSDWSSWSTTAVTKTTSRQAQKRNATYYYSTKTGDTPYDASYGDEVSL